MIVCALVFSAALLAPAETAGAPAASPTLVSYSFDDEAIDTGPDTYRIYQESQGKVRLSTAIKLSGYRSVELTEVAGDGAFPELQGYFALRRSGKIFAHFSLLSTDPGQTFNLALAGPRWFTLAKDGIAFWMLSRNGFLYQYSDSMPKRLVPLLAFVWYTVDVAYDIDAGLYDLTVRQEGAAEPVVSLTAQPNASSSPGSCVDKFSFIGDTGEDTSSVVYYVDDVIVSADLPVAQSAFVAPGRRKLFVDAWNDYQRLARSKLACLPATQPGDLGFDDAAIEEIRKSGQISSLASLVAGRGGKLQPGSYSEATRRLLRSASAWRDGCAALEEGRAREALKLLEQAASDAPRGTLQALSVPLALAHLQKWREADSRLASASRDLGDDPRYAAAAALVGLARGDLDRAEEALAGGAQRDPEAADPALISEQYFFVLLWKNHWSRAEEFAGRMAAAAEAQGYQSALWQERVGDAAFLGGEPGRALEWYEKSYAARPDSALLATKLSDVHFKLGDLERERRYREAIYGSLKDGD